MVRLTRVAGALFVVLMVALAALPAPTAAQPARLCFAEVPDCIEGRFAEYWQQNGGLPVFGFPIGPASMERVGEGEFLVQPFERNRFELHPENARPYDVLLGRLGVDRLAQLGRPWEGLPKAPAASQPGCQYFGETQHLVCGAILGYWSSNGLNLDGRRGFTAAESLALFGLPISEAAVENGSDGRPYLTQWFERARFEVHPELGPDVVLLGLLGREVGGSAPAPQPAPQPVPQPAAPESVNARVSPSSGPAGSTFVAQGLGFRPGKAVGVYVTRPDQSVDGAPFQVGVGGDGATEEVEFTTGVESQRGVWVMTFEGVSSGRKGFAYFLVTAPAEQPGDTSVPPAQNGEVSPTAGPGGTVFMMYGWGFRPGERVGVYITGPDQSVVGAPFQVSADGEGVSELVTFTSTPDTPPGVYAVTFEGVSSGAKAIVYFRVW